MIFLLIWAYCFKNNKKIYCTFAALQWIALSGLRHWSVGADTLQYYNRFVDVKYTSWSRVLSDFFEYIKNPFADHGLSDPGYHLLVKIFQISF